MQAVRRVLRETVPTPLVRHISCLSDSTLTRMLLDLLGHPHDQTRIWRRARWMVRHVGAPDALDRFSASELDALWLHLCDYASRVFVPWR